jgi:hypothetical protein
MTHSTASCDPNTYKNFDDLSELKHIIIVTNTPASYTVILNITVDKVSYF